MVSLHRKLFTSPLAKSNFRVSQHGGQVQIPFDEYFQTASCIIAVDDNNVLAVTGAQVLSCQPMSPNVAERPMRGTRRFKVAIESNQQALQLLSAFTAHERVKLVYDSVLQTIIL